VIRLYDADRCPYCARARIVLAEKQVEYETVVVDLDDRPRWIYDKNALGRVPVLEDGPFVLPESEAIMEYLEERFPQPALLPDDPGERAHARVWIVRFDRLASPYYALRRGDESARSALGERLAELDAELGNRPFLTGRTYGLADIAYVPWILRARDRLGVALDPYPALEGWLEQVTTRPAVTRELELAAA
jgi:glutathione S-transferase